MVAEVRSGEQILTTAALVASASGQAADTLQDCVVLQDVGNVTLILTRSGFFGSGSGRPEYNCFTGDLIRNQLWGFPKGSSIAFGSAGLWIGGLIEGRDTAVTTTADYGNPYGGTETAVDISSMAMPSYRSILDPNAPEFEGAVSEQDFIFVYSDTFTQPPYAPPPDPFTTRPHLPLGLEITQRSYAWSYEYCEDIVFFDMTLRNISDHHVRKLAFGIYSADGFSFGQPPLETSDVFDELGGFVHTLPSVQGCGFIDTLDLAWHADNDGEPIDGQFTTSYIAGIGKSVPQVASYMFLGYPIGAPILSYNWWTEHPFDQELDFGPRRRPSEQTNYRDFKTGGTGAPKGDGNKYYLMRSGEVDYDPAFTGSIGANNESWLPPPTKYADDISDGQVHEYILSVSPIDIPPAASTRIAFAVVLGEHFHTDPDNLRWIQDHQPGSYYEHLDFSDLAKNALWAKWIYDNPGVDTDGDGYAGKQRICVVDSINDGGEWIPTRTETTYYEGDGIPDWRAAGPPPAPKFWVTPTLDGLHIRINGFRSETTKDIFSQIIDFEGYRIYIARDERESSYSLYTSFDRQNYDKWVYNPGLLPNPGYEVQNIPFTLAELKCLYGAGSEPCLDESFNPLDYGRNNHYHMPEHPDSVFYFTKHDYNASDFGVSTEIRKTYPATAQPEPGDTLKKEHLTEDGYLKYYEYECYIQGLLPTVPYWVNVTAFDFGSAPSGLQALETSKVLGAKSAYPASDLSQLSGEKAPVYVYPNPYRIDGHYRLDGYEGRGIDDRPDNRLRLLHFENLPARCTIEIHSLDGDLLRRIHHDVDPSDPNHTHDTWNLITRNGQAPVSGLYYWVVEDENGNAEIGKFMLIF